MRVCIFISDSSFSYVTDCQFPKMFRRFFGLTVLKAQDEEDLVDPQTTLREKCNQDPRAQNLFSRYQECNDRVHSRKQTSEVCSEELFDYLHVVEHCVSKDLFSKLK